MNSKTREKKPFFKEKIGYFDGSVLALIPKEDVDLDEWVNLLNDKKRFVCRTRNVSWKQASTYPKQFV